MKVNYTTTGGSIPSAYNNNFSANSTKKKDYKLADIIDINNNASIVILSDRNQVELTYSYYKKVVEAKVITEDGQKIDIENYDLPRIFDTVTGTKDLKAICQDAYAKVVRLSDEGYKFYLNHRLLGGGREEAQQILQTTRKLYRDIITVNEALRELNIDCQDAIDDSVIKKTIGMIAGFILETLDSNNEHIINNIDFVHYKTAFNLVVHLENSNNAYRYLQNLIKNNGIEDLANVIFNCEEKETVSLVKTFFNSVNSTTKSDEQIQALLKNLDFIKFLYPKILSFLAVKGKKSFILEFKQFELLSVPTSEEREYYNMPAGGICHGSCQLIATLEDPLSLERSGVLQQSTILQNQYSITRTPDPQQVSSLFLNKITDAVNSIPDEEISLQTVTKLVTARNKQFLDFLENNNINPSDLLIAARVELQEQALNNTIELHNFLNAELIFDNASLNLDNMNSFLNQLKTKIQGSTGANRHLVLITFIEKDQICKASKGEEGIPQAHDILIRIDTNLEGNIQQMFFVDLEETGLYNIKATDISKNLEDSLPNGINLIDSYFNNFAVNLFDEFSVKYVLK